MGRLHKRLDPDAIAVARLRAAGAITDVPQPLIRQKPRRKAASYRAARRNAAYGRNKREVS